MLFGVPSPVSATLPAFPVCSSTWAAATTPTEVGAMMPLRSGYAWSSPWATVLLRQGLDVGDLGRPAGLGGANLLEGTPQRLRRLLAARRGDVEVGVVHLLGEEGDAEAAAALRAAAPAAAGARQDSRQSCRRDG